MRGESGLCVYQFCNTTEVCSDPCLIVIWMLHWWHILDFGREIIHHFATTDQMSRSQKVGQHLRERLVFSPIFLLIFHNFLTWSCWYAVSVTTGWIGWHHITAEDDRRSRSQNLRPSFMLNFFLFFFFFFFFFFLLILLNLHMKLLICDYPFQHCRPNQIPMQAVYILMRQLII